MLTLGAFSLLRGAAYQGTIPGFIAAGHSRAEAERMLARSVELARSARDSFWDSQKVSAANFSQTALVSCCP